MPANRLLNFRLVIILVFLCAAGFLIYGIAQESPRGALQGIAVAQESGKTFTANAYLTSTKKIDGETLNYSANVKADGKFEFGSVVAGEYKLSIYSSRHSINDVPVSIAEAKTEKIAVELQPQEPNLWVNMDQNVFTPDETFSFTCNGFVDSNTLSITTYKVDTESFMVRSQGSMYRLLGSSYYLSTAQKNALNLAANPALTFVSKTTKSIARKDAEGIFVRRIKGDELSPGLYIIEVTAGGLRDVDWVLVTWLGLVTKSAPGRTLAYAVDLKTGEPVQSADLTIYTAGQPISSGRTDSNGLYDYDISNALGQDRSGVVLARNGESIAFVSSSLSSLPSTDNSIYVYTDRPVYRPNQTVFYKGLLREKHAYGYTTPVDKDVTIEVRDPNDTLLQRVQSKTDKFGGFSGSLNLNREAPTGQYSISVAVGTQRTGSTVGNFTVSAYRKPEFSVNVTFDKPRYARGDVVKAKISASYYFGAPVVNATVAYNILRSSFWLFEDYDGSSTDDSGYSQYGYGQWVKDGTIRTDKNGEATVEFVANWDQSTQDDEGTTDQRFELSASVTDKADAFATGDAAVLVTRGEFAVSVRSNDQFVKPGTNTKILVDVKDYNKRPIKNQLVTVALIHQPWGDGRQETLERRNVKTNSRGQASLMLPIKKSGSYLVFAFAKDARGNGIKANCYLYSCHEGEQCHFHTTNQLEIITDKRSYTPGETAKVLIISNNPGATALVSVEGSRLYEAQTVKLDSDSAWLEFKIRDDYKPNIYFSACYVKDKQFNTATGGVNVSVASQSLNVAIKPDKKRYKPGQKATYDIKVTDSKGKPVSAELSLGVVDEAIYAVQPDYTTPITDFFYAKTWNSVDTGFSFPQIYLSDPDKAGAALRDEPIKIRRKFLDTAYWNPAIITDTQGMANVSFEWPDNLTTWRATARAITFDTLCGQSQNTVLSQQDMLVRLELPRFMVQGDSCCLVAAVHNYTGTDQRVRVRLKAPGLKVRDNLEQTVNVRKDGSQRVEWTVSAPKAGAFKITVTAEGQKVGDAIELVLPVKAHGEQMITAANKVLTDTGESKTIINIRKDSIIESTNLQIRLAPSLAATMLGSLDYLAGYPYGCTEQTVSRFLPDVILYRSLKSLGISEPELQKKLPDMVSQGFSRLYTMELPEGGWGWSEYGNPDVWMTAYVTYALIQARDAGFPVNQDVLNRAMQQLSEAAPSNKVRLYPRAFAAYVLALGGYDSSKTMEQIIRRKNVNNEALAVLALGFQQLGMHNRAEATLQRLFQHAIVSGDTHWAGISKWAGGDLEATALALQALLRIRPNDDRAYGIVRWLMSQRFDNYWMSTRGTAFTLYAMSEFLGRTKELTPDYDAVISINGKQIRKLHFDKASIFDPQVNITIPGRDLRKGRNELTIQKTGPGNLYFSTNLTQYIARNPIPPLASKEGISIERSYYKPKPQYFSNPIKRYMGSPVNSCKSGDIILVRLIVTAKQSVSHMMVEDFIPAGCEIVDRGNVFYYDWQNWWVGRDIRDDRIAFYVDSIAPGKRVIEYNMRAGFAGKYTALPAQFFSMYNPSARTTTGETGFIVK